MTPPRRGVRLRRWAIRLAALLAVLALITAGVGLYLQQRLVDQIDRIPNAFEGLTDRPDRPTSAEDALNILLVGTNANVETETIELERRSWIPSGHRPESLMLLHINGDRSGASLIWIPWSSRVEIPGVGRGSVSDAVSAGPSSLVASVEATSDVRVDHLAVLDWDCFRDLAEESGVVQMDLPAPMRVAPVGPPWPAGRHDLAPDAALEFAGEGDSPSHQGPDLIRRQQVVVDEIVQNSVHTSMRNRPWQIYGFLDTVAGHLAVDEEWSVSEMRGLVVSLRHLRSTDIRYLAVPIAGAGSIGGESVIHLDEQRAPGFWDAVRTDQVDEWLEDNPDHGLPAAIH